MSLDELSPPDVTGADALLKDTSGTSDGPESSAEAVPEVSGEAPGEVPAEFTMGAHALATQLVGKLCHDFISPAGAIISGLDLLEDPTAQDMKQEALNLISASAKKLVTLVHFARVAFGAATTSEAFNAGQLKKILDDIFSTMRAELEFDIPSDVIFEKPVARALLNLGLLAGNALPVGGKAKLCLTRNAETLILTSESRGPRARLKPEAIEGLTGLPLGDGLSGQWIQPHWLYSVVHEARGTIEISSDIDLLALKIILPA